MKNIFSNSISQTKISYLNFYFYSYLFFIILQLSQTLVPYSHGDALYYHLVGPKLWKTSNWNSMWEDLSHYAQAGYFDLIYFMPTYLIESKLINQIVCQFTHFFFSIFLGSALAFYIIKDPIWSPICGISVLTIANDSSFFFYAKNDGALALFSLLLTYLIVTRKYNKYPKITGILIGIVPGVKISGFLVIFPVVLLLTLHLFRKEITFKNYFLIGILSLISLAPQLVKNFVYTGNPLFPGFISILPGNLTASMLDHYNTFYGNTMTGEIFIEQLIDFFSGKSVILLTPIFLFFFRKTNRTILELYFVGISIFFLYLIYNGSLLHPRYYFSSYFLVITSIFLLLKNINFESKKLILLVFVISIIDSKIDLSIKNSYTITTDYITLNEEEILNKYIPITNIWKFIKPEEEVTYIISDHISNSYYLPKNIRLHTAKQSLGADFILKCKDKEALSKFSKYKYALILNDYQNDCYNFIIENGDPITKSGKLRLYKI